VFEEKAFADDAEAADEFGEAVSLSGDLAAIAAPGADGTGNNTGAVYVFRREGGGEWVQEAKLAVDMPSVLASVSIDGDRLVANGPRVFRRDAPGVWVEEEVVDPKGSLVDLDGNRFIASEETYGLIDPFVLFNVGAAWVYRRQGQTWVLEAMLQPDPPGEDEFFGHAVALEGARVVVGNKPFSFSPPVKPLTYFYEFLPGVGWTLTETLEPGELSPPGVVPSALDLDGGVLAWGNPSNDAGGEDAGAVYTLGFGGPDCNGNGQNDLCDIAAGLAEDLNGDGIPDSCQCPADVNGDGKLDILDFIAFQELFAANDPAADCTADGTLDVLDFICFQAQFQAGCP